MMAAARLLEEMLATDPPAVRECATEIKDIEHRCDTLTHQVFQAAAPHVRDAVRPRGHSRAGDVARRRDGRHRRRGGGSCGSTTSKRCARCPRAGADHHRADRAGARRHAGAPSKRTGVQPATVEINRLENEADRIHQRAVERALRRRADPIAVIKWKELFDLLEDATDRCEDVANVIEGVVVKHG